MLFTWGRACALAAVWLQLPRLVEGAEYSLLREYSGPTFFEGWEFFDAPDNLTHGDVEFIGAAEAGDPSTSLAYVDPVTNRAIIKVDNTSVVPLNEKRKTVRITTEEAYDFGTVWVIDAYHLPYGCSVWSGLWSWHKDAGRSWPTGGEVDIFEAINRAGQSQMGLHTHPGCNQSDVVDQLSTAVRFKDCAGRYGTGCIVMNTDEASYGPPLNEGGGGVYVTEYLETGIDIWFFARDKIPASLSDPDSKTLDTSTLGTPMGSWPSTNCDLKRYFKPQNIVIYMTLCGDFAGHEWFPQTGCQGRCYEDFVVGDGSNYSEAYFDVASVRIFSVEEAKPSSPSSSSSSTPSPSSSSNPQSSDAPPGTSDNNIETQEPATGSAVSLTLHSFYKAMTMIASIATLTAF